MPFALPVLFDLALILALASVLRLLFVRRRASERLARQLDKVRDEGNLCNRHVQTLSELNHALQSSETLEQAIKLTVPYLPRLFAVPAGALYVAGRPGAALCRVHQWGERKQPRLVLPTDCRALSDGKPYAQPLVPDPRGCRHLLAESHAGSRTNPSSDETTSSGSNAANGEEMSDEEALVEEALREDVLGGEPAGAQALGASPVGAYSTADAADSDKGPSNDLCVPLAVNGVTLALLNLHEPNGRARELLDNSYVVAAIEQISLAIWNLRLRETLRQQSIRDPLTKLYNRRYLEESLLREVSRSERNQRSGATTGLAVLMIDVDHFKRCNDLYGHEAGDLLLAEIGGVLRGMTRASDIASRYGGEEFVVALADVTLHDACIRAEEIRSAVQSLELSFGGRQLPPTSISVGVAVYPEHGETPAALIRAADAAMYSAKRDGRNRVRVAPPGPSTNE